MVFGNVGKNVLKVNSTRIERKFEGVVFNMELAKIAQWGVKLHFRGGVLKLGKFNDINFVFLFGSTF